MIVRGFLHRENDLPAVVESNGVLRWYWHGIPHRARSRPAKILSEQQAFLHQGKFHNLLGLADSASLDTWSIYGVRFF